MDALRSTSSFTMVWFFRCLWNQSSILQMECLFVLLEKTWDKSSRTFAVLPGFNVSRSTWVSLNAWSSSMSIQITTRCKQVFPLLWTNWTRSSPCYSSRSLPSQRNNGSIGTMIQMIKTTNQSVQCFKSYLIWRTGLGQRLDCQNRLLSHILERWSLFPVFKLTWWINETCKESDQKRLVKNLEIVSTWSLVHLNHADLDRATRIVTAESRPNRPCLRLT